MFQIDSVQSAIRQFGFDGWLLYDFRGLNVLARRVLEIPSEGILTRRWFYFIPAVGEPRKLVHQIEPHALDHLPGKKTTYLRWQELEAGIDSCVHGVQRLAMEYVPRNANPYVSRVDSGTVELVRSFGPEIRSSGDLIQLFEACWDEDQWNMHKETAIHTRSAFDVAFAFIADQVRKHGKTREIAVQQTILEHFRSHGLVTDNFPICAVGPHSGDPHYEPRTNTDSSIGEGDFVLIDLWAKLDRPRSVYSDLTWVGFVGREVPDPFEKVFNIVAQARDAAIHFVQEAFSARKPIQGWQVDQAARDVIEQAGYGKYFFHRTGHSIGQEDHGNGANMDNLETREERRVLPKTCFSIEPGIYLPDFGVRSEVNIFIDAENKVLVTGGDPQTAVLPILKAF